MRQIQVAFLGGILLGGILPDADARSAQDPPDQSLSRVRRPEPDGEAQERLHLPAPRKMKVAAGRGKAQVYVLDRNRQRIPDPGEKKGARFLETRRTLHWAVVTGVIDHRKVLAALGMLAQPVRPSVAAVYCRVELERSALAKDATWSGWRRVDSDANAIILDNLPINEEERVSQEFVTTPLVDPLPWLTEGTWKDADVEDLLPPERRNERDRRLARAPAPPPQHADPPQLMLRTLDFTAEPGRTYRYRSRVVAFDPRWRRREFPPKHLIFGPWSSPTAVVTIPPAGE